jgi:hypothetical protein
MITPNRINDGPCAADFPIAYPFFLASAIWTMILTLAVIGATFALSCLTPFAALAIALAGTIGLRASLHVMIAVWLANQVIGFGFFHFPLTVNTVLFGVAIGVAAVATTIVASVITKYGSHWAAPLRLGIGLLASFAAYEIALLPAGVFFGDLETFRPAIVAQIGLINGGALIAMVVLNEVIAALGQPWLGRIPRLARSW